MLLPSSIQRAEDSVGMAIPTVGLSCASAGPASAMEPSAMADRVDLSRFIFHSQSVELKSPRYRGLLLAPMRIGAWRLTCPIAVPADRDGRQFRSTRPARPDVTVEGEDGRSRA